MREISDALFSVHFAEMMREALISGLVDVCHTNYCANRDMNKSV